MKKIVSLLTLCSFLCANGLSAHDEVFYSDIDDDLFNRGKFVGEENQDYLRARKRSRSKNWAFAAGTTVLGIVTLILVKQKHHE